MPRELIYVLLLSFAGCTTVRPTIPDRIIPAMTGSEFYKAAASFNWQRRDSFALEELLNGNSPAFLKRFIRINTSILDSGTGKLIRASYWVSPDYLSIGSSDDWARIPLTPMAAQRIADSFNCFLPTRKIVDEIYSNAKVKLEPVPLFAYRDSTVTMYHHHLIIEGQRKSRKGLIAGIKKDIVLSEKISKDTRPNRVAIYGWHLKNGKPIQPVYTGHVNWYVDYSHGVRLVYRKIKVSGKWMDYKEVMNHPVYKRLLCDEADCSFLRY